MSGQLFEIPALVERPCGVTDAIENHGDESERLPSLIAVPQGLRQEAAPQPLSLMNHADSQPRQNGHGKHTTRQVLTGLERQVAEVNLPRGQGVVARNGTAPIEQDFRYREMFSLVLECFGGEPVVNLVFAGAKQATRVLAPQMLQTVALGKADAVQDSPRIREPRRRCALVSFGVWFKAFQKANCSSGVKTRVFSRAASTSRRA